jgi:PAS domain S-box-containing protein
MNNTELKYDLQILYELAMNTNIFNDISQNTAHFVQLLLERKQFRRVAFYTEPAINSDKNKHKGNLLKYLSLPHSNDMPPVIQKCDFPEPDASQQFIVQQQCMVQEKRMSTEMCLIFKLQKIGLLIIFTGDDDSDKAQIIASQLSPIIRKFAESLNLIIARDELIKVTRQLESQNQILQKILNDNKTNLQKNQHKLEIATVASNIAQWDWNIQTGEVKFDNLWANMLGYTLEELEPVSLNTWVNLCHPDDMILSNEILDEHINGHLSIYRCEVRMKHKDGYWKWILDQGKVYQWDEDGKPLLMTGTHQDITLIKEAMEALQESEAKYRTLVESSSHFIAIVSEGKLKFANRSLAERTGIVDPSAPKKSFTSLFAKKDHAAIVSYCMNNQAGDTNNLSFTATLNDVNGNPIEVNILNSPLTYRGKPARMIIMEDITGRKFLEEQLNKSQKMEALGALSGGIAHDFNNILQTIRLQVELLKLDKSPDTNTDYYLDKIEAAIEHGGHITSTLLGYHKKEQLSEIMIIDVGAFLKSFLKVLRSLLPTTIIIKELIEPDCHITASKSRLEQMLLNLAMNAKDAMNNKGTLSFRLKKNTRQLHRGKTIKIIRMEVEDNGVGMEQAVIDRLYEPYFTTKAVGKGTGLGLHTVFGIVKELEGTIKVQSAPGQGANFIIEVPESITG